VSNVESIQGSKARSRDMKKLAFSFVLVAGTFAALPAEAQELLPSRFGSWNRGSCKPAATSSVLAEKPTDSKGAAQCEYGSDNRKIAVLLEKFGDPSAAYEQYTSGLHPGMVPSLVGNNAALDGNRLWLLSGNLVLQIDSQQLASESDLRELIKSLDGHADKTPLPPMRAFLPSDGLIQGTQRYSLGPKGYEAAVSSLGRNAYRGLSSELGFANSAEAMLGGYANGEGGQEVLLLVEYPNPQLAEQQLHHLQPLLTSKPEFAGTTVVRDASLLSLVLSPSSPEMADRLRKSIKYDTAITWNEPSQTLTDPPWFTVLKTIFFAAAGFCVFAALAGLIFGVFRLVVKRLFPHKVFDRTESLELLQLGLNSKEIDPDDFY